MILCHAEQPGKETTGPSVGSPSPLSAIEIALKRLDRFERLERLERDSFAVSAAVERLELAAALMGDVLIFYF